MKKVIFLVILVAVFATWAMAQSGLNKGPTTYVPTVDVQGAHENGGRGCAGCHAPHSGGRGAGGQTVAASGATPAGTAMGDQGLWGTDTYSIIAGGGSLSFSGYAVSLTGAAWGAAGAQGPLYTGVATCLSCHDGNISKGAMMSGQAYEQSFGLLNFATNVGSNGQATAVSLYGNLPIPTLLGNDGGVAGDYSNDHPIGPAANLGAVLKAALSNGLVVTINGASGNSATLTATPGTTYGNFVAAYGMPAVSNMANPGDGVPGNLFVTCTTCHNQHVMNVYSASGHGAQPIAGGVVKSAATIFFVQGPYNPGSQYDPTHVPSTNAFCLQCHFSHSSQYFGSTTVGVAY